MYKLTHNLMPQLQEHPFEIFPVKKHTYHGPGSQRLTDLPRYECLTVREYAKRTSTCIKLYSWTSIKCS